MAWTKVRSTASELSKGMSVLFVRRKSALLSADDTVDHALISGAPVERVPSSQLIPYKGALLTELCLSVL